ncbi:MAG: serine/threonine protein kinase, partial [Akkermansia muciniphila]
ILSVLNAGGFGITYLALDNPGSRYVVIKECMPDAYACRDMETGVVHPRNEQTVVNFSQSVSNSRQEASVLSQLNHPGIVQVFDMFDANGTCYYVMENIQGQTLFDLMTTMHATGQTMEPAQATDLLFRLLDILHYLHSMGVYHCDIKPSNIFIQPDGTPKLIDFGAVRTKTLQHQGLVQITPGYTPPDLPRTPERNRSLVRYVRTGRHVLRIAHGPGSPSCGPAFRGGPQPESDQLRGPAENLSHELPFRN